jgi:hypothetical protein
MGNELARSKFARSNRVKPNSGPPDCSLVLVSKRLTELAYQLALRASRLRLSFVSAVVLM